MRLQVYQVFYNLRIIAFLVNSDIQEAVGCKYLFTVTIVHSYYCPSRHTVDHTPANTWYRARSTVVSAADPNQPQTGSDPRWGWFGSGAETRSTRANQLVTLLS